MYEKYWNLTGWHGRFLKTYTYWMRSSGATTSISYASFANDGFYTKGTGSTYPVVDYQVPVHAVKSVTASNGVAGSVTATYQYKGLKAHLQGKGLLGLTAQTVNNTTLGTVTESGIKSWYDNRGHEVLVETVGPKSVSIQQKTFYNTKGLVSQKQSITGNLTTTETYGYDGRGRVSSYSSTAGQSIAYTYGNRTATTVTNGRTYIKTTDAWGSIKSAADPVTSISYTYKSLGKPQSITTDSATFSMTYYDTGTQETLTDPNAGTITYEYDAAGRVKKQTDGRGKVTDNVYDALGRLDYSTVDGEITDYVYGTSGYDMLRLIKKQTGNNYIAWSHNQYGRVETETRQIDGTGTLSFGYGYNAKGELETLSYPGGLSVSRQYDAYGNLQKVLAGTQAIWELTGETGTVTTTQMGNNTFTATQTRNTQGLLTNLKTMSGSAVLHDMGYDFNGATGNLNSRTGMTAQTESFLYDNLDRLQDVQQGGLTVMSTTYESNGNIHTRTGLGEYKYENLPHAVSLVENTGGLLSSENQAITYTAFNKVSQITDKVGADNYQLDLIYGPDQQRWKSTLKKNNNTAKTIVFAGDYETITENGVAKQLYYISGNDGLAAVYVKQSGQTDKTYYVCKDHLGSIIKLIDVSGTEVFKASYDAWGNRTVTNNTFAFHRGYTGHEHLPEFGLINMNGRMYDPVLGRFLSPDPFVQAPGFSQSFNRYSYCLNNPLRYTDPSGNIFFIMPYVGFGMNGGWEFGLSAGIGLPNSFSAQISVGYNTGGDGSKGSFTATVGVSYAGASAYAGYNTQAGFIAGIGYGFGGSASISNFNVGSNMTSLGISYSSNGGYGANFGGIGYSQHGGFSANPSITAGYKFTIGTYGGNILTGEGSIFESVLSASDVDVNNPVTVGEGMVYSNEYAAKFSGKYFQADDVIGVTNLHADGTMPSGYERVGDYVKNVQTGEYVGGLTENLGKKWYGASKGSNVYIFKSAFTSKEKLFLTMGHEYIHAAFNFGGHLNINRQEAVAYKWNYNQATKWNFEASVYKIKMDYYASFNKGSYPYNLNRIREGFMNLYKKPW